MICEVNLLGLVQTDNCYMKTKNYLQRGKKLVAITSTRTLLRIKFKCQQKDLIVKQTNYAS